MKRAVIAFLIWAVMAPAASPQDAGANALRAAMDAVRGSDWAVATSAADPGGVLARDIVEWHRLRAGDGTWAEYLAFLARRPDWPGLPYLKERGEAAIPPDADAQAVLGYFSSQLPQTGTGSRRLAEALRKVGAHPVATDEIRRAWLTMPLGEAEQAEMLADFPEELDGLHEARLDMLLWQSRFPQAAAMLPHVGEAAAALGKARLALLRGERGVDELIEAVPPLARDDPGLAHARLLWRIRAGRTRDAEELMLAQSARPDGLGAPEYWADARLRLARGALREGQAGRAYLLASTHGLQAGSDYAALEWLAGHTALTALDEPSAALGHFRRFRVAVDTPISLGRAGYWEGRALAAMGRDDEARDAYRFASEFQTSFYGQLAAIEAGEPMSPELAGDETYPDLAQTALADSSVLAAARLLHAAGESALFRRFLRHLAEAATPPEMGALADLALQMEEPYTALYIAKYAADGDTTLPRPYFPVPDGFDAELPVSTALALAVARRESEFNAEARSRAGARGLMQLMPPTADKMAGELGLTISTSNLTEDPALNIRLGTAYLAYLAEELDGYLPAMLAGYNAGPSRAADWMDRIGDPRGDLHRAIDWIEAIPFAETRNYVMRVLESHEVYRARLAGAPVAWELDKVLTGAK